MKKPLKVFTPELLDRLYSAMVRIIDMPDIEYRRWSFIYAVTEMHQTAYLIDSRLGPGARLCLERPPVVVCDPDQVTPHREILVCRTNIAMAKLVPPKKVKSIAIRSKSKRTPVPVTKVDTPLAPV